MSRLNTLLDDTDSTVFCKLFVENHQQVLTEAVCTITDRVIVDHSAYLDGLIDLTRRIECHVSKP